MTISSDFARNTRKRDRPFSIRNSRRLQSATSTPKVRALLLIPEYRRFSTRRICRSRVLVRFCPIFRSLLGVPMDLGVTNRNGSCFGPRVLRTIERIGPYNHILECAPLNDLAVADIGDVPFRSRYNLAACHEDIEAFFTRVLISAES
jgi:hypothetical protein